MVSLFAHPYDIRMYTSQPPAPLLKQCGLTQYEEGGFQLVSALPLREGKDASINNYTVHHRTGAGRTGYTHTETHCETRIGMHF